MKIALMMKDKPICHLAYQWCKDNLFDVTLVAPDSFHKSAIEYPELVAKIEKGFIPDLVVSFLFDKKIKDPILSCPKLGCINFHPAPLPEYRGCAPYAAGIMDGVDIWGVTAHFMDKSIDTGDIIKVRRFEIDKESSTSATLSSKSHSKLIELFIEVMIMFKNGSKIPRKPQGYGKYTSFQDFEKMREIKDVDDKMTIDRKARAFWCPPHEGAYYYVDGKHKIIAVPSVALGGLGGKRE